MGKQESRRIPDWAAQERTGDLLWIQENLHVFFPAAQEGFKTSGRGAILTDTTTLVVHPAGESNGLVYVTLDRVERRGWPDVLRMVNAYDPASEFVCVLLKQKRESAYQIRVPPELRPTVPPPGRTRL